MAIKIGSNISSFQAQRRLVEATSSLGKTYERLSAGQRINRASDDAAGLAIAKTLDAKAKIFTQGVRNVNDGLSYTNIAGGALKELKEILLRQRELAAQASNGTYSDKQRAVLDQELQSLSGEWNRVLDSTTFNGRRVFSAHEGTLTLQSGIGEDAILQAAFGSTQAAAQDDSSRVSTASDGTEANGISGTYAPAISADGRYIAFRSSASNLVTGDTNGVADIFIKDLQTGETRIVSTSSSGVQGNAASSVSAISANGRYVAFQSSATNLVSGDTNAQNDIFVKDLQTGETRRVSTSSSEAQGNGASMGASISGDGRYVTFWSAATNLVSDDNNARNDVFVKDLQTGMTTRVSTDSSGAQADNSSSSAVISADGRYVVFESLATNLVAGDSNTRRDIFVKDLQTGEIARASVGSSGAQSDSDSYTPVVSADGRHVAFQSAATNLVTGDTNAKSDIFVKDVQSGETRRVSSSQSGVEADGFSYSPAISTDGLYLAFYSNATNIVAGDINAANDIFITNLQTGEITIASTSSSGVQGNAASSMPAISADGRYVSYCSDATNLVSGDTNGFSDYFTTGNPLVEWSTVSRNQWIDISTRTEALLSQARIDNYLNELNTIEGTLGGIESRLGTAVGTLQSMTENFRAAESRITDADMGQEVANLTRTQVVQQAAASVLAQANQQPQIALQLLRI